MAIEISNVETEIEIIDASQLTAAEREDFDYLDWDALEEGSASASFVRYRDTTYSLADFSADWGVTRGAGLPEALSEWHGYLTDSFFSGIVIRIDEDYETVTMGLMLVKG